MHLGVSADSVLLMYMWNTVKN